mgnify:FL=1
MFEKMLIKISNHYNAIPFHICEKALPGLRSKLTVNEREMLGMRQVVMQRNKQKFKNDVGITKPFFVEVSAIKNKIMVMVVDTSNSLRKFDNNIGSNEDGFLNN